jgi:hypothetical protein
LRELQRQFAEGIFSEGKNDIADAILADGLSGERRLRLYRNNTFSSLTEALRAVYPVIEQLVGKTFFEHSAQAYLKDHPSLSGNLHDFGQDFADFLEAFAPASELAYLGDVARLEWSYHCCFHAAGHAPLAPETLAAVPETQQAQLRFYLHPASRLLSSPYPILDIWQTNQKDYRGETRISLEQGQTFLLVIRGHDAIEFHPLQHAEFSFLRALADGQTLACAYQAAVQTDKAFHLGDCLGQHVVQGTLVAFDLLS